MTGNTQIQQIKRTPYYTIPENSTLMGSTAMTALLGRVPIQGAVTDPFPFKVLIGRENLIANGIDLPDVEGAIVSGTSTGDWTLSCVRSEVTSITFVFADGRISNGRASGESRAVKRNQASNLTPFCLTVSLSGFNDIPHSDGNPGFLTMSAVDYVDVYLMSHLAR